MTFKQGVRLLSLLVSASQVEDIRMLDIRERTQIKNHLSGWSTKTPISLINEANPPSRMLNLHAGSGFSWPWSEPAQGQVLSAGKRKKIFEVT